MFVAPCEENKYARQAIFLIDLSDNVIKTFKMICVYTHHKSMPRISVVGPFKIMFFYRLLYTFLYRIATLGVGKKHPDLPFILFSAGQHCK